LPLTSTPTKGALLETPSNHQKIIVEAMPSYLYVWLIPHEAEEKNTIEGITRIVRLPHQMNHVLGNQKEGKKKTTCLAKE